MKVTAIAVALPTLLLACSDGAAPTDDGGETDGGADSGRADAGRPDAGAPDAGPCAPPAVVPAACNGAEHLCARRYDEVAYATSHNAMSNQQERWIAPNQQVTVTRQLEDGMRGLMLDTHDHEGVAHLCHGFCSAGRKPLVDGLREIDEFLRCHPAEVVTLVFESYVTPEATAAAFEDSGLMARVFEKGDGPWPTLREMIDSGERVVVLTDDGSRAFGWYHHVWDHAWETHFAAETPEDLSCAPNRGDPANDLFVFNHFLTNPVAGRHLAEMVNHDPFLSDRLAECRRDSGRFPNFVTVDFHDIGDVLSATAALNR